MRPVHERAARASAEADALAVTLQIPDPALTVEVLYIEPIAHLADTGRHAAAKRGVPAQGRHETPSAEDGASSAGTHVPMRWPGSCRQRYKTPHTRHAARVRRTRRGPLAPRHPCPQCAPARLTPMRQRPQRPRTLRLRAFLGQVPVVTAQGVSLDPHQAVVAPEPLSAAPPPGCRGGRSWACR